MNDTTTAPRGVTPTKRETFLGADDSEARRNISWGAVFAGVVTFVAVAITLSLVGLALGLGVADPTSDDPLANVGWSTGLWMVVTIVGSLTAAGFIAGALAVKAGFLHGVVTWATSVIALTALLAFSVSAALGALGSIVGSATSAVGSGVSSVASATSDAVGTAVDGAVDNLELPEGQELGGEIEQVLADTGEERLQPDFLRTQVEEAAGDVRDAGEEVVTNPDDADAILDDLSTRLQERIELIGEDVDRDAVATAIEQNTDLSAQEAQEATDNAVEGLQTASAEAEAQVQRAEVALQDAREGLEQAIADARQAADDAADAAARGALWTFFGLVVGLAVASFAGLWGSRSVAGRPGSTA